jgi:hypothetical protein
VQSLSGWTVLTASLNGRYGTDLKVSSQKYVCLFVVLCVGDGVLAYFAGAEVCSTPAALICAANYCRTSAKKPESIDETVNTRIDTRRLATNIVRNVHVKC